ncbi:MAG: hypothetical protein NVS2B16_24960 [Chloroflexota bacterium]
MSVTIKSAREVEVMRVAGQIVANALVALRESVEPGMTTKELDRIAERSIRRQGAEPAFPYINDFPGTVCTSVNDEVVHGITGKRVLRGGILSNSTPEPFTRGIMVTRRSRFRSVRSARKPSGW